MNTLSLKDVSASSSFDKSLPESIRSELIGTLRAQWSQQTLRSYESALKRYSYFLTTRALTTAQAFPASDALLATFVGAISTELSYSAVKTAIAAVRAYHVLRIAPWNASILTSTALSAAAKLPQTTKKPRRPDITTEMLLSLHSALNLSVAFDAAVWAAALTAFWCQCRLGELFSHSKSMFQPYKLPKPSDCTLPANTTDPLIIHLPWTKTRYAKGADITVPRQNNTLCPVQAIIHLLAFNSPGHLSLFAYKDDDGSVFNLTKSAFLSRCNSIWLKSHAIKVTGHSFRIGGTTHLLLKGVDPKVVQIAGRWSTDNFLRYWRKENEIINKHISFKS